MIEDRMRWPEKRQLLGVRLSVTDYDAAVAAICEAARRGEGGAVAAVAIHAVVLGTVQSRVGAWVDSLDLATPDGQGLRWALNWLHKSRLRDRVYGPELALRLAREAAKEGLGLFLYGSTPEVAGRMKEVLEARFENLRIVGVHSPPFRALTPEEEASDLLRIRDSGAHIVLVGLGSPRQEAWVVKHRAKSVATLVAVGAAFDFLSGNKRQAPVWMQRRGLEMVFRVMSEPRRLWRRFVYYSVPFVPLVLLQKLGLAEFPRPGEARLLGWTVRIERGSQRQSGRPGSATEP